MIHFILSKKSYIWFTVFILMNGLYHLKACFNMSCSLWHVYCYISTDCRSSPLWPETSACPIFLLLEWILLFMRSHWSCRFWCPSCLSCSLAERHTEVSQQVPWGWWGLVETLGTLTTKTMGSLALLLNARRIASTACWCVTPCRLAPSTDNSSYPACKYRKRF